MFTQRLPFNNSFDYINNRREKSVNRSESQTKTSIEWDFIVKFLTIYTTNIWIYINILYNWVDSRTLNNKLVYFSHIINSYQKDWGLRKLLPNNLNTALNKSLDNKRESTLKSMGLSMAKTVWRTPLKSTRVPQFLREALPLFTQKPIIHCLNVP